MARSGSPSRQPARGSWGASRARTIYNLVLSAIAVVLGLLLALAPSTVNAREQARPYGAVLAGYGLVRGYYFYRRLRASA